MFLLLAGPVWINTAQAHRHHAEICPTYPLPDYQTGYYIPRTPYVSSSRPRSYSGVACAGHEAVKHLL